VSLERSMSAVGGLGRPVGSLDARVEESVDDHRRHILEEPCLDMVTGVFVGPKLRPPSVEASRRPDLGCSAERGFGRRPRLRL
jgi:hypothetical protein